jgi:hypothetical protein
MFFSFSFTIPQSDVDGFCKAGRVDAGDFRDNQHGAAVDHMPQVSQICFTDAVVYSQVGCQGRHDRAFEYGHALMVIALSKWFNIFI